MEQIIDLSLYELSDDEIGQLSQKQKLNLMRNKFIHLPVDDIDILYNLSKDKEHVIKYENLLFKIKIDYEIMLKKKIAFIYTSSSSTTNKICALLETTKIHTQFRDKYKTSNKD